MSQITLSNGAIALVDDADLPMLMRWKWKQHSAGYAYRTVRKGKGWTNVYMHRLLMNPPDGLEVDHINRNKLDNMRENLRTVPHWKNAHNLTHRTNTRGTRGVTMPPGRNRWIAKIYINGQCHWLGSFKTQHDAERVYAEAARQHGTL